MENKSKCPGCNGEFIVSGEEHVVKCPFCGRETDALKARKYYSVFHREAGEKKEAHGEKYFQFGTLLEIGAHHLVKNEFEEAEQAYQKAIDMNPRDYRGYLGVVACKTKNYTDLKDTSHKEFLLKATEIADEDGKKQIASVYRIYDAKASMNDDEYENYLNEKQKDYKSRIKKAILGLATVNGENEKKAKTAFVFMIVLFAVGLITCVLGCIFSNYILLILGAILACSAYAPFLSWNKQKKNEKYYCFLVELFNRLVNFAFDREEMKKVLDYMTGILLGIKNGESDTKIENWLEKLSVFMQTKNCKEGCSFLKSQPLTARYFK